MADTTIPTDLKAGITDIMTEVGSSITIRKVTKGSTFVNSDPTQGKTKVTADTVANCVFYDYKDWMINGDTIKYGDRKALISLGGLSITVDEDDLIVDGSVIWKVISVERIIVSGVEVTDICQIRE